MIYIVAYIIYVLGYTCQCACTKAGQTCLTNDPKQRSQFVIWNMIGTIGSIVLVNIMAGGVLTNEAICEKGLIVYQAEEGKLISQILAELDPSKNAVLIDKLTALNLESNKLYVYNYGAAYGDAFYNIMVPFVVIVSAIYTIMAIAAIWEKDRPQFWGVAEKPAKMKDYIGIIKGNKEIRWLVLSSGLNKLASTVATSGTVAFMLYGCLMGDYNGLYVPFYALCFVFMGIFFVWGSKTAGNKGQKRGVAQFTLFALLFYIGVLIMLCIYDHDNPATYLSLFSTDGGFRLTINFYTIVFIIFYGCGYGAFNCCDQLTIPMVADCTDYETYRSGNYVPGIMGTIFSLVDKIIVQAVNAVRKAAVQGGMSMEQAMATWQTIDQVPDMFVHKPKPAIDKKTGKEKEVRYNFLDRIYDKVFTKHENIKSAPPSSNAVDIPEEFRTEEVKALYAAQTTGA